MTLVVHLVLLLHLLGFAALLGGCVVQFRSEHPEVNEVMLYGAIALLVTGIALVLLVIVLPPDGDLNTVKVIVKGLITLVITILVVANRRFASVPRGLWGLITGLTVITAVLAVLW